MIYFRNPNSLSLVFACKIIGCVYISALEYCSLLDLSAEKDKINLKKLFSENWNFLVGSSQQEADDCENGEMQHSQDLEDESLDFCQKKSSVGASILSVSFNRIQMHINVR